MATEYQFPSSTRLMQIEQEKIPVLTQNRVAFDLMPIMARDEWTLIYEQYENYFGLQQVRGLGGAPKRANPAGMGAKEVDPGVYGEFMAIEEEELSRARRIGTYGTPVDISERVLNRQEQLLSRRLDRMEYLIWTLLTYGQFTATGNVGQVLHTDIYNIQTYPAAIPWATFATAKPLFDLRAVQLLSRGKSVDFGQRSRLYMNRVTFNALASNLNANDLGSKRAAGLASITGVNDINEILMKEDLPTITIYDGTYYDDNKNLQLFIPNDYAILVGVRSSGVPVGQYQIVKNASNPDEAAAPYMFVHDSLTSGGVPVPREIQVHDGHNGGPVLFFPSSIVSMHVAA